MWQWLMMQNNKMRTKLTIDDDVMQCIKALAPARRVPVGRLVSELLRTQLQITINERSGLPVLVPPPGSNPIKLKDIQAAEDKQW